MLLRCVPELEGRVGVISCSNSDPDGELHGSEQDSGYRTNEFVLELVLRFPRTVNVCVVEAITSGSGSSGVVDRNVCTNAWTFNSGIPRRSSTVRPLAFLDYL